MATIQDHLNARQDNLRRLLFDKDISLTGREYDVIRISEAELDMYGDAIDGATTFDSSKTIPLTINYPQEIPIDRFRYTDAVAESERFDVQDTGTFFFEVLPIEIFSKFTDNIETGDYLIHAAEDEVGNSIVMVLKTSEMLGSFGRSITWKKHFASPFKGKLPEALELIVEELKA